MHSISDIKIPGAELAHRYAVDLRFTNGQSNVVREILKKNDSAKTSVVDEDDTGDDGKNCRHCQKFDECEAFHKTRFISAKPCIFEIHTMSVAAIRNGPNGISLFIVNTNMNRCDEKLGVIPFCILLHRGDEKDRKSKRL